MKYLVALLLLLTATPGFAVEVIHATVSTAKGQVPLTLELAVTPKAREIGLMERHTLAPNDGMAFIFTKAVPIAFWMKNTLIPLDMLFIDAQGKIVNIKENAPPLSLDSIPSNGPVLDVIELAGGKAKSLGIAVGNQVNLNLPATLHVE